jgi:hypothetical protein
MERMLKEIEEMNAPSRVVPLDEAGESRSL